MQRVLKPGFVHPARPNGCSERRRPATTCGSARVQEQAAADTENAQQQQVRQYRLQQTPEERSAEEKTMLVKAEASLAEYCSSLPGEGEDSERCWLAYDYFEQRKEEAESGCTIDWTTKSRDGPDCAKLDSFESFVRQLLGQAPMSSFAHLLFTLRKGELHDLAQHQTQGAQEPKIAEIAEAGGGTHFELQGVPESGKDRLAALFYAMDVNGDGKLNVGEFRAAMEKLGMSHLSGPTVSTIFQAMDIHGPLTLQEFLHIVEAEEIVADTSLTRWLRQHKGESVMWGNPAN